MFTTTCVSTALLSEPARTGDRHTMPARSPSVGGIHQGQLGFQRQCLPLWELALQAICTQTLATLPLKLQTYPQIKYPLYFFQTSGLLPLIILSLSYLLTPATRILAPCRPRCSTPLIIT